MIGSNLGLTLPLLSDTLTNIVAKTSAALSAIQVSIADQATQAAINITNSLSMGGNWLTNAGGVILADGNNPSAVGSIYYHSNEFYMVDSTAAVKVTLNGALNASGFGAIGGDYGGSNPALVSFDTASGQYRFYTNGGTHVFGDVSARALLLSNGTQTTKFSVNAAATNQTLQIGTFAATGAVVWDGTKLGTGSSITTNWTCLDVHASDIFHSTSFRYDVPLLPSTSSTLAGGATITDDTVIAGADASLWRSVPLSAIGLRVGDTITGLKAVITKTTAAAALFKLRKKNLNAAAADCGSFDTANWGTGAPIAESTWTPFTSYTIAAGDRVWLELALAKATDAVINVSIFVTH